MIQSKAPDKDHVSKPASEKPSLSVGFLLMPNFTLLAFASFVDVLRLAADEGDRSKPIHCHWSVIGTDREPVRASCGIEISPWEVLPDPNRFDYLVVVGGLLHGKPKIQPEILRYLKQADQQNVPLIGVCTGSFVLARAALMHGYRCCVSWFHLQEFQKEFPKINAVADDLFVVDSDRITCAGGIGVIHLAAYLITRHCGHQDAEKSLRILISDLARNPRSPQPAPLISEDLDEITNDKVRRAMLLIEQHLHDPLSVQEIAWQVNLSVRQLERGFQRALNISPMMFSLRLRLRRGHELVKRTTWPISNIAQECGFSDGSHFSRKFRETFGQSPSRLRQENHNRNHLEPCSED